MPDFGEILNFIKDQYGNYGYLIVFLGAYLENTVLMGLIFPGGTLLILSGIFAAQGVLAWPLVFLLGVAGMFLGSSTDYWIGRGGLWRLLEKTRLHRRFENGIGEARQLMKDRGGFTILMGHLMGQLRTFVALMAGVVKMPYPRFALYESLSALVVTALYIGAGYIIGDSLENITSFFRWLGLAAFGLVFIVYLLWKRRKTKPSSRPVPQDIE